ncbi:ABC transporter permease [Labrys wisconsinensis]|uniref:Peptide/nickel transport system permease protein n=1 Tax=Labrys wisconsinensis TaxID=425677 RepID=A0ABU0JC25_9HYPH|nr:ABC transporter permease [Labrys wisconsinensis]MDQ0471831.1 peptide/nickel transport system permease protein [Labrys wisconsinensis]
MTILSTTPGLDAVVRRAQPTRRPLLASLPWTGRAALAVLVLYVIVAAAAPLIARNAPTDVFVGGPFDPPSAELWLGTDGLGRDVASRLLYGSRTVLSTACGAAAISTVLGGLVGLLLGLRGGLVDEIGMRLLEIAMSIPSIIVALLVLGFAGSDLVTVILTVGLLTVPNVARVVRAATQAFTAEDFVAAARARGEGLLSIGLNEILPNVAGTLLVEFSIRTGYAVLFIGGLGFLGFGAAPPAPDWGSMINEGRSSLDSAVWPVLAPAIGIAVLVTSVNLLTDALAQSIGPARRGGGQA